MPFFPSKNLIYHRRERFQILNIIRKLPVCGASKIIFSIQNDNDLQNFDNYKISDHKCKLYNNENTI